MRMHLVLPAFLLLFAVSMPVAGGDGVVSTMRNVNAVMEARGFYLTPASDMSGKTYLGVLAPTQAFEIVRPGMSKISIGRLYTSCTCVQLVSPKRNFAQGERAVLELRNIHPTPPQGQRYAIYVQITSPIRTTLRFDTFVQSSQFVAEPEPQPQAPRTPATTLVEEIALEEEQKAAEAAAAAEASAEAGEEAAREAGEEIAEEAQANRIVLEAEAATENADDPTAVDAVSDKDPESAPPAEPAAPETKRDEPEGVARRISIITLGVSDLSKSIKFYEDLGWKSVARGKYDNIAFIQLNGQVLSLYPVDDLLRDQYLFGTVTPQGGGLTLTILVDSREEVERTFQRFIQAGGTPLKHPAEQPSGATTGYIADPDGHSWEISSVPQFHLDEKGGLWID